MSLRIRLTLGVVATVAAAVMVVAYSAYASTRGQLGKETDGFLLGRYALFAPHAPTGSGHPLTGGLVVTDERPVGGVVDLDALSQLFAADGSVSESIPGQPRLPIDAADRSLARTGGGPRLRDITLNGVPHRMLTAALTGGSAVQIARSTAENEEVLAGLRTRLLLIVLIGTVLAGLVAATVARRTTGPIEALTHAAEDVAESQDLKRPIEVHGTDEVGRLALAFNTMLLALDTSREQQRRLVVDASHELRTPLTAVRTNIEVLQRVGALAEDEHRQLLAEVGLELGELTDLIGELVELATDARTDEPVEPIDISEVAANVAARFRRRSGRPITVEVTGDNSVEGRRSMIDRAVSNLVDNALKFSPPTTAVEVVVTDRTVEVMDRGAGLEPGDHARLFDRFSRADSARSLPGSGLGLAIVKQVAEVHDGKASLRDRDGGGSIARLEVAAGPGDRP